MRAIAFAFLFACSPTLQTKPVSPLGPDDGVDHGIAASLPTSREVPRTILLSSRSVAERCRIAIGEGARTSLSSDETRIAIYAGAELAIWNPRTCDATTHAVPDVVGTTFIGRSHEVLAVQHTDRVALTKIARDGETQLAGSIAQRPTAWTTSPDGTLALVGVTDETRSTLAVWDLTGRREMFELTLPVVERQIDSITFSRDGKIATLTVPVFSSLRGETVPRWQLEIDYDTRTWRPTRKLVTAFRR